jgi:CHAD domain-containing protein
MTRAFAAWRRQPSDLTLHAARIAVRRYRVLLRVFAADADPHGGRVLRERLGGITDALGVVRDVDIVAALAAAHGAEPGVVRAIAAARQRAAATTARAIDPVTWAAAQRAASRLAARLEQAATVPESGPQRLTPYYRAETRRLVRRVRRDAEAAESDDEETLHIFRIRLRRLRYMGDLLAPYVRRPGRGLLRRVKAAEQALGAVHDVDLALAFLVRRQRLSGVRVLRAAWQKERRRRLDTFRTAWRVCARRLADEHRLQRK